MASNAPEISPDDLQAPACLHMYVFDLANSNTDDDAQVGVYCGSCGSEVCDSFFHIVFIVHLGDPLILEGNGCEYPILSQLLTAIQGSLIS